MKSTCIAVCVLLLTSMAAANSCVVESLAEQESSRYVEVTVFGEEPPRGVRIEIYPYEGGKMIFPGAEQALKPRRSLVSNTGGKVGPLKLAPGHYYVVAKAAHDLKASLYLNVLSSPAKKRSMFSIYLMPPCNMPPPHMAQWPLAIEQMPIKDRVRAFSGKVYDPSGAPVAGTSIRVIRKATEGKGQVAELTSDSDGRFTAQLPEGVYIAFFLSPGFTTAIVAFEITKEASEDLRVMLMVGSTT